ncbi:MAG: hypothetical protein ACFFDF_15290 [Candidatus Odinarchaeota archaeon]
MKKYYLIFKLLLLTGLFILIPFILYNFFYYNLIYSSDSIEVSISWMVTISYFIVYFYLLLFLINIKIYFITFCIIVIWAAPAWIIIYALETFVFGFWFPILTILRHLSAILCFSILSPGLSLLVIKYIKNYSNRNKPKKIFNNYRIHEGFVGIFFIVIAIILVIIRNILIKYETFRTNLRIYLAIDMIFLYLFLFFGSFLIFRDWRDLINFKLVQKREPLNSNFSSSIFYPLTYDSIKFFKSPKILLYPIGILISSIAVNIFMHGTYFLPEEIFTLKHETLVLIGIIFTFIGSGMLGLDWYRLFAKIYPELYQNFEQILKNLRKDSSNKTF